MCNRRPTDGQGAGIAFTSATPSVPTSAQATLRTSRSGPASVRLRQRVRAGGRCGSVDHSDLDLVGRVGGGAYDADGPAWLAFNDCRTPLSGSRSCGAWSRASSVKALPSALLLYSLVVNSQ